MKYFYLFSGQNKLRKFITSTYLEKQLLPLTLLNVLELWAVLLVTSESETSVVKSDDPSNKEPKLKGCSHR